MKVSLPAEHSMCWELGEGVCKMKCKEITWGVMLVTPGKRGARLTKERKQVDEHSREI